MSDYPSTSPFGPHGPQVGAHTTTPNPTAPSAPVPTFGTPDYSSGSGGGGGGYSGGGSGSVLGGASLPAISFASWMLYLAIGGAVLGALAGFARASLLHFPPQVSGIVTLRFGIAGAAIGAGIPPVFRAGLAALKAAAWIALALVLFLIAAVALGQTGWLQRWH